MNEFILEINNIKKITLDPSETLDNTMLEKILINFIDFIRDPFHLEASYDFLYNISKTLNIENIDLILPLKNKINLLETLYFAKRKQCQVHFLYFYNYNFIFEFKSKKVHRLSKFRVYFKSISHTER